jgi:abhydrolase domain-containing protein 12
MDYRGFGDSTGEPNEEGLLKDARAIWDYASTFSDAAEVVLAGQSLGTGVVAGLAGELAEQNISPRAVVMIAPFTSITDLLDS